MRKLEELDTVCRLNKAIYGLRQSGRQWHIELDKSLRSTGLTPTYTDPYVFVEVLR